ncbi:MAG: pyridine nucleotide-disulfide oxidoreductase, partial [Bacteroidaceae bacterium]|nr:pyridine nucleotide-disulfide oxidoreductase [Bacteroidaceae bacterium]
MKKIFLAFIVFLCSVLTLSARTARVWVEAESFVRKGGWNVDQQFTFEMGSPYLIAHGMGSPVEDASTRVHFPHKGTYHIYVRTFNWTSPWSGQEGPGRFTLSIDGKLLQQTMGHTGNRWMWQYAGTATVDKEAEVSLHDLTGFDGRCDALWFTTDKDDIPPTEAGALETFRQRYDKSHIRHVE